MQIILLQNTVYKGRRYIAGENVDFPHDLARKWTAAGLAYAEMPQNAPELPQNAPELPTAGISTPEAENAVKRQNKPAKAGRPKKGTK